MMVQWLILLVQRQDQQGASLKLEGLLLPPASCIDDLFLLADLLKVACPSVIAHLEWGSELNVAYHRDAQYCLQWSLCLGLYPWAGSSHGPQLLLQYHALSLLPNALFLIVTSCH
ncbi:hypothetical protein SLEP1_g23763 [Rubroshorea leprosula]|uniref:Uncharacterized protein n=1 Tax=Rubroshorea leprosula TaxID=152421 RepID=A0AAV5JNU1_9ROSI|nr:hypothetical protein SLEP1_g23763 [Rubroshorea leprosula]